MTSKLRTLVLGVATLWLASLVVGCGEKQVPDEKLLKSGEYLAPPKSKSKSND